MSVEAVAGILVAIAIGLVGVIYGLLRSEDKRLAKNMHGLRNKVQAIIMALASRGINVPGRNGDDDS